MSQRRFLKFESSVILNCVLGNIFIDVLEDCVILKVKQFVLGLLDLEEDYLTAGNQSAKSNIAEELNPRHYSYHCSISLLPCCM